MKSCSWAACPQKGLNYCPISLLPTVHCRSCHCYHPFVEQISWISWRNYSLDISIAFDTFEISVIVVVSGFSSALYPIKDGVLNDLYLPHLSFLLMLIIFNFLFLVLSSILHFRVVQDHKPSAQLTTILIRLLLMEAFCRTTARLKIWGSALT